MRWRDQAETESGMKIYIAVQHVTPTKNSYQLRQERERERETEE